MRIPRSLVPVAVAAALAMAAPAGAHRGEDITPSKAGPIKRSETTLAALKDWFGRPSGRKIETVACSQVITVRWGQALRAHVWQDEERHVAAIFIRKDTLSSDRHGKLELHTRKGLQVGDRWWKLRNLYPNSDPIRHDGHAHYRLRTGRDGGYVMAKLVERRVVQLEVWPYEFC